MTDWEEEEREEDWDEDEEPVLVRCPACKEEIYEDAEQCPYCGEYVTHSSHPFAGRPLWWVILGILGIVAVIFILTRF